MGKTGVREVKGGFKRRRESSEKAVAVIQLSSDGGSGQHGGSSRAGLRKEAVLDQMAWTELRPPKACREPCQHVNEEHSGQRTPVVQRPWGQPRQATRGLERAGMVMND